MSYESVRWQLDHERRTLARADEIVDVLPQMTRVRGIDGDWHCVRICSLSSDEADAAIAEQVEYHRELGVEFEWTVCRHDRPADLCERLARHGFDIGECEAILVLDLSQRPDWVDLQTDHEIVRIRYPSELEMFSQASEEIFGTRHEFVVNRLARSMVAGSTQQLGFIAMADGSVVSVGRLETHPESAFAGLYGGGTVASHRGRGFYRAMVAARARDAMRLGARYLSVDALPTSRPILERLGFVRLTDSWPCTWRPGRERGAGSEERGVRSERD
jgi:hypothetical protein